MRKFFHMLWDWLIRKLGGVTKEDHEEILRENIGIREGTIKALEEEVEAWRNSRQITVEEKPLISLVMTEKLYTFEAEGKVPSQVLWETRERTKQFLAYKAGERLLEEGCFKITTSQNFIQDCWEMKMEVTVAR